MVLVAASIAGLHWVILTSPVVVGACEKSGVETKSCEPPLHGRFAKRPYMGGSQTFFVRDLFF